MTRTDKMNIQDAKDSVRDAIETYLAKDPAGNYVVPRERQRPIMLMGAPGLGKTAVMSQIAAELGIGYVQYTITHHTRQSAIGLPMIETEVYGGEECSVTRYTMSEIVASVYDRMKKDGKQEGILFIDEINCVSETLAPAMLDLLQNKRFGPHPIPDGWILVAAGNPPEFNDSAREFDIATQDRIRIIEVEPDTDVWLRYAMSSGMNDAITYYLKVKPQNLLKIERTVDGMRFVTPRAWEDLSVVMNGYASKGLNVGVGSISQYIRDPDIAAEFFRYMEFHKKYREDYDADSIIEGSASARTDADAEGRLAVISILIGKLNAEASDAMDRKFASQLLASKPGITREELSSMLKDNLTIEERRGIIAAMNGYADYEERKALFDRHLTNAMEFARASFGDGPETASLLTGLLSCYSVVMFSEPGGTLYSYNDLLLSEGRDRKIQSMIEGSA